MTQLSNKALSVLLVLAVVVTLGGAFLSFRHLWNPTVTGLVVDTSISEGDHGSVEVLTLPVSHLPLDKDNKAVISISNTQEYTQQVDLSAVSVAATLSEPSFRLGPSENKKVLVHLEGPQTGHIRIQLEKLEN